MFTGDDPLDLRDVACLTAESKRIHGEYASHVDEHGDLATESSPAIRPRSTRAPGPSRTRVRSPTRAVVEAVTAPR